MAFSTKEDETAKKVKIAAAATHYLESWGDVTITRSNYSLVQPTIRPLFNTKQFQEGLLAWTDNALAYYDFLKSFAVSNLSGKTWNQALHDGFTVSSPSTVSVQGVNVSSSVSKLASAKSNGLDLILYTKTGLGDGQQANNPWLQEFPDPITRVSWDNYITVSKKDADKIKTYQTCGLQCSGLHRDVPDLGHFHVLSVTSLHL